jgi:hypothetical protein
MTEATTETKRQAIPELVRSRITQVQERLGEIETGARGRISRALTSGNTKLRDLDRALARVSRADWTVPGVRRQLGDLRDRAESLRASALKRVAEMPGTAVEALATGTRAPIRNLAKGIADIAKRIENGSSVAEGEEGKGPKPE